VERHGVLSARADVNLHVFRVLSHSTALVTQQLTDSWHGSKFIFQMAVVSRHLHMMSMLLILNTSQLILTIIIIIRQV